MVDPQILKDLNKVCGSCVPQEKITEWNSQLERTHQITDEKLKALTDFFGGRMGMADSRLISATLPPGFVLMMMELFGRKTGIVFQ